jgi:hypothetical protein
MSIYYWLCWLDLSLQCYPTSWLRLPIASRNATEIQAADICIFVCLKIWADYCILIYTTHCEELMKSVCSYGSSSLLFMMKVMVGHFVSDSHKVMTTLIVMLIFKSVVQISLQSHRYVPVTLLSVEYLIDTYMQALLSNCLVKMSWYIWHFPLFYRNNLTGSLETWWQKPSL